MTEPFETEEKDELRLQNEQEFLSKYPNLSKAGNMKIELAEALCEEAFRTGHKANRDEGITAQVEELKAQGGQLQKLSQRQAAEIDRLRAAEAKVYGPTDQPVDYDAMFNSRCLRAHRDYLLEAIHSLQKIADYYSATSAAWKNVSSEIESILRVTEIDEGG